MTNPIHRVTISIHHGWYTVDAGDGKIVVRRSHELESECSAVEMSVAEARNNLSAKPGESRIAWALFGSDNTALIVSPPEVDMIAAALEATVDQIEKG